MPGPLRFSRSVAGVAQAMSIKFNNLVYEMQQRGEKVTVMSLGEAFFDLPLFPMDDLPYPAIFHYSHSRGIPELRERLAEYYRERFGVAFDPGQEILVTAGSKAAIYMTLLSILDPGDEVILHEPAWVSYPEQVKLCGGVPVLVPHDRETRELERYVTERTRAIVVTNPHNPRGLVYPEKDLAFLLDLCRRFGLYLLSDETYSEFLGEEPFVSVGRLDPGRRHGVVFNSISKNHGISGWRIGYAIGHRDLIAQVLKVNQHLITCPATILQHYVARRFHEILALTRPQIAKVVGMRRELKAYMDRIGLRPLPGTATFYFFVSIEPSRLTSEEFCTRLLLEEKVSVVPGIGYGTSCDRFIRVSVGTETMEANRAGLDRIKSLIERTS